MSTNYSDCMLWPKGTDRHGYGAVRMPGPRNRVCKAHRLVWEAVNYTIPDGMDVLHRCDNPRCVNPDHLFLGTHSDNMADKSRKGRHNKQKLTPQQIAEIRALPSDAPRGAKIALARRFGVGKGIISATYSGQANRHVL